MANLTTAVVLVILCWSTFAAATHNSYHNPSPASPLPFETLVGRVCFPPFGFRARTCGDYEVLESFSETAFLNVYGPNVCHVVQMIRTNEFQYTYQRYCDWVYSRQNYYQPVQECRLICQPTSTCTNRNQTFNRTEFQCCEGFTTRPQDQTKTRYDYLPTYHQFKPIQTLPEGCPRAVGASLMECLIRHGLNEFINIIIGGRYGDLFLSTNDSFQFTIFAPTDAAFEAIQAELVGVDRDMLVGNHIINGTVLETDLIYDGRFWPLNELTLHSTSVTIHNSVVIYSPGYSSSQNRRFRFERFINGAQVINPDACRTDAGTLHIIDRVLMPGPNTISQILSANPEFSMFTEALQFADVFNFLDLTEGVSRTVFAPTNEAFADQIPPDLFDCLKRYMRIPLNNLVLYHIGRSAEYTSSLRLRMGSFTLLTSGYNTIEFVPISATENGTILLGSGEPKAMIIQGDIAASNGVIHIIDRVLMPQNFDYGMCASLVPTTPPSTTMMEDTTMEPVTESTTEPTAAPIILLSSGEGDSAVVLNPIKVEEEEEEKEEEEDYKIDYENNP